MPPLKKWKKQIINGGNCWNDLRNLLSKKEAQEVCRWDGWHWILKRQLEMFFGLKKYHKLTKKERRER